MPENRDKEETGAAATTSRDGGLQDDASRGAARWYIKMLA
jgi:hypothetical protein